MKSGEIAVDSSNRPHAALHVSAALEAAVLKRALESLIRRHEVLGVKLAEIGGEPCLVYDGAPAPALILDDLGASPIHERSSRARARVGELVWQPFDVTSGPLFRMFLITLGSQGCIFGFVVHHFIADGASVAILLHELLLLYRFHAGLTLTQPLSDDLQFHDYLLGMNEWLQTVAARDHVDHWVRQLIDAPAVSLLPRGCEAGISHRPVREPVQIDAALYARARAVGRELNVSVFVILLAVQKAWLARLTGLVDITIEVVTGGRALPGLVRIVGNLADRLFHRTSVAGDPTFADLVARVRNSIIASGPHVYVPSDVVRQELSRAGCQLAVPYFNFVATSLSRPREQAASRGWSPYPVPPARATSKAPRGRCYGLTLQESSEGLSGWVIHERADDGAFGRGLRGMLCEAVEDQSRRVSRFSQYLL